MLTLAFMMRGQTLWNANDADLTKKGEAAVKSVAEKLKESPTFDLQEAYTVRRPFDNGPTNETSKILSNIFEGTCVNPYYSGALAVNGHKKWPFHKFVGDLEETAKAAFCIYEVDVDDIGQPNSFLKSQFKALENYEKTVIGNAETLVLTFNVDKWTDIKHDTEPVSKEWITPEESNQP